jgi:hypothetical protein
MAIQAGFEGIHTFQQLLQGQSDHIRQGGMVQVGRVAEVVQMSAPDDLPGYANHHRVCRHRFNHHCVGPDAAVVTDINSAKHLGTCANDDPVSDGGMPFPFLEARPPRVTPW